MRNRRRLFECEHVQMRVSFPYFVCMMPMSQASVKFGLKCWVHVRFQGRVRAPLVPGARLGRVQEVYVVACWPGDANAGFEVAGEPGLKDELWCHG